MKKLIIALVATMVAFSASAELKRYTNVLDKIPSSGYVGFASVEFCAPGNYNGDGADFGITTTHGWMVRPNMFLGGGVGYIRSFRHGQATIPIYAEGKLYFPSQYMRRIYPHIGLRLGGQLATQGSGGVYSQLACGFRVPLSEKIALNVEVGPQYASRYSREPNGDKVTFGGPFRAAGTKFGFFGRISVEF